MITRQEFHNGLRLLRSIDSSEIGNPEWWGTFRDDPYRFFIRCADEIAEKIWSVMLARGVVKNTYPDDAHGDAGECERLWGIKAGHICTEQDVKDINNLIADHNDELGRSTNAWHEGRIAGLHDIGGDALVAAANAADEAMCNQGVARAMKIFAERTAKLDAETAAITGEAS